MTPDTCYDIKNPIPSIAMVNSKNQIYIVFDEEVSLSSDFDTASVTVTI